MCSVQVIAQPPPQPRQPAVPLEDALRAAAAAAAVRKAAQPPEAPRPAQPAATAAVPPNAPVERVHASPQRSERPHATQLETAATVPAQPPSERGHAARHGSPPSCPEPAVRPEEGVAGAREFAAAAADAEQAGQPQTGGGEMDELTAEGIAAAEVLVAAAREVCECSSSLSFHVMAGNTCWRLAFCLPVGLIRTVHPQLQR